MMCSFIIRGASTAILLTLLSACSTNSTGSIRYGATSKEKLEEQLTVITQELIEKQRQAREESNREVPKIMQLFSKESTAYKLGSGDILSIVVWGHTELASAVVGGDDNRLAPNVQSDYSGPAGFVVDERGMITYPFVGEIKLESLTVEQARIALAEKLSKFIKKPNIAIRVRSYRSKRIYVDGELKNPGLLTVDDIPMSLVEAINRAGGMLPTADQSQINLVRQGVTYVIDLPELMGKGMDPKQLVLMNGDVVRVLSRDASQVFVSGEVNSPRAITMHDGRLTLNEALGASGGINPLSGDPRQVYVIRKGEKNPRVYLLDASDPSAFAIAEGFMLAPKDVVYVAATPLTNWHRTISSLLPGALSSAVGAVGPRQ